MIGRASSYYHTVVGRSGRLFRDDDFGCIHSAYILNLHVYFDNVIQYV